MADFCENQWARIRLPPVKATTRGCVSRWEGEAEYVGDKFEWKLVNQWAVDVIFLQESLAVPFMELLKDI